MGSDKMIILDTHIWLWWLHDTKQLTESQVTEIKKNEKRIIGISAVTCWEIAKLVEKGRLELPYPVKEWFKQAFKYPGTRLYFLTPEIAIGSAQLPGELHGDPADQIIIATARFFNCPLVTSDEKILNYPHVKTIA